MAQDLTDSQLKDLEQEHGVKFSTLHRIVKKYNVSYAAFSYSAKKRKIDSVKVGRKYALVINEKLMDRIKNYKPKKIEGKSIIEAYVTSNEYKDDYISKRVLW